MKPKTKHKQTNKEEKQPLKKKERKNLHANLE